MLRYRSVVRRSISLNSSSTRLSHLSPGENGRKDGRDRGSKAHTQARAHRCAERLWRYTGASIFKIPATVSTAIGSNNERRVVENAIFPSNTISSPGLYRISLTPRYNSFTARNVNSISNPRLPIKLRLPTMQFAQSRAN